MWQNIIYVYEDTLHFCTMLSFSIVVLWWSILLCIFTEKLHSEHGIAGSSITIQGKLVVGYSVTFRWKMERYRWYDVILSNRWLILIFCLLCVVLFWKK